MVGEECFVGIIVTLMMRSWYKILMRALSKAIIDSKGFRLWKELLHTCWICNFDVLSMKKCINISIFTFSLVENVSPIKLGSHSSLAFDEYSWIMRYQFKIKKDLMSILLSFKEATATRSLYKLQFRSNMTGHV